MWHILFHCVFKCIATALNSNYKRILWLFHSDSMEHLEPSVKCLLMQQVQEESHKSPHVLKSEKSGHICQSFWFHPPEDKNSRMHRSLEGSQVCVLFERSMAEPELATLMELSVKSTQCPFSYDGLVQLPQATGHLICLPFESSVYINWRFKK